MLLRLVKMVFVRLHHVYVFSRETERWINGIYYMKLTGSCLFFIFFFFFCFFFVLFFCCCFFFCFLFFLLLFFGFFCCCFFFILFFFFCCSECCFRSLNEWKQIHSVKKGPNFFLCLVQVGGFTIETTKF